MSVYAGPAATVAVFAALIAAGCGETVVDDVKVADTTQRYLERSQDEKIRSVDCPSDQPVDPGVTFGCQVVLAEGEQKIVTVRIRNENADWDIVGYKPKR